MTRKKDWWLYPCAVIGVGAWGLAILYGFKLMHEAHPNLFH